MFIKIGGEDLLGILLELIGSIGTLIFSSMKDVTEEEIKKNIEFLKRYEWFQKYLEDNEYRKLIFGNDDARFCIGKLNIDKMHKVSYQNKWEVRIKKSLIKILYP